MSIMAGLSAESIDREYNDLELIRRISHYFQPWRRRLAIIVLMLSLRSLFGAATPIVIAQGVDQMAKTGNQQIVALVIGVILVLGVLVWLTNLIQQRLTAMLIGDVMLAMRKEAFEATIGHDMSFYDEYQSGRIVSRITSDSDEFGRVAKLITSLINQLLLAIILIIVLLTIEWRLTLILLLIAPSVFIVARTFRGIARRVTRQSQRAVAEVNVSIQEVVTGIGVAKNFRREQGIYEEFDAVNHQNYQVNVRRGLVLASLFPTLNILSGLATAILLYFGGLSVTQAVVTAGAWYLFMNSVNQLWFPMLNLAAFESQFQAGLSATERLFALMDAKPVVKQVNVQPLDSPLKGQIDFETLTFGYRPEEPVLKNFDLHIKAGESVALVGHTGAGKSSIAKLVTRFYEYQEGCLYIDGQDIRTFDLSSYRRHLGIVSQVPFLFDGTVADNIRYTKPEMSEADIYAIVQQIGGDWVETLPNGLATDVGERGARLSMGQRQLVVLARVLAQNPAIFILDEATASIDPFTEAQIQATLELLFRDRTSIVIAHRLSTVKAADRILVLQQGQIIEEGNHDELMAQGGHYAELYNTYFRHQSLDYRAEKSSKKAVAPLNVRS